MKVLRILRRRKIKLSFILILLAVFIVNTYAWFTMEKDVGTGLIVASVSSWAVEFVFGSDPEQVIESDTFTIEIDEFYPGVESIEKKINIYNIGEAASTLEYEIDSIWLYGKEILKNEETSKVETVGEETTTEGVTTADLFGNTNATIFNESNSYGFSLRSPTPFQITYTYDKTYIAGQGGDVRDEALFKLNFTWDNDEDNNIEDTKIGNIAYDYKNDNNTSEAALKINVKITARRA